MGNDIGVHSGIGETPDLRGVRGGKHALVTGSAGLIGSACVKRLCSEGWQVYGIDNNTRQDFFGPEGSTAGTAIHLSQEWENYHHHVMDVRARDLIRETVRLIKPDFIIHTAGQPAHDYATRDPFGDWDTNANGTFNLLVAARDFCPKSPFVFTSTSKVYGDRPNRDCGVREMPTRYDFGDKYWDGIPEDFSIDASLHSIFGASKVAADIACQEFGRYYQMPIGIFRGGCLTGAGHAAVELHGYLAYIVKCAKEGRPYTIFGYKGKQVRDQIHADDVASLFMEFQKAPHCGEVYNFGGGRENSLSILETIALLKEFGLELKYEYREEPRIGDHCVWISDLSKVKSHFPNWRITRNLWSIVAEMLNVPNWEKHDAAKSK